MMGNRRTVASNLNLGFQARNLLSRILRCCLQQCLHIFNMIRWNYAHIYRYLALCRYLIRMNTALDFPKHDGGLAEKRIFLQFLHAIAGRCQHISHTGNGIHALFRTAGMGCLSVHGYFKPVAPLVGSLNFTVGRFRIHHQAVFHHPAKLDHPLNTGHVSLFITGSNPL